MAVWQILLMAFLVVLPMALMVDFHPHQERLTSRGRPLTRNWPAGGDLHPDPDAAHAEPHHP